MSTTRDDRSSDEIRRDIERTRAEMDETVDALENRLSPGQLLDQVWGSMKGGGGRGVGDVVRDHPVPLALMGLGVAWLAVEKGRSGPDHDSGPGTWARAEGRRGPYRGDATDADGDWEHAGMGDKLKDAASSAGDKLSGAGDALSSAASKVKGTAADAASTVKDKVTSDDEQQGTARYGAHGSGGERGLSDKAGDKLDDARDTARRTAHKAQGTFDRVLHDQPLALGALSFGLGLAAGLAAPTTRWEDEHLGETADTLKEGVKARAKETAEKAKTVAGDAAEAALDEADSQDLGGSIGDKVKDVAYAAKDAAEESAERENLDADSLTAEGRKVAEQTKEDAKRSMS